MKLNFVIYRYEIILLFLLTFIFLPNEVYEKKLVFNEQGYKNYFKLVALTFDDGPHPYYTQKIVNILNKHNVKATFFLVGRQVEKHPELVKYILENSRCKIANHTYSHRNLTKLNTLEIYKELFLTQKILKSLGNEEKILPYFRPPGGWYNDEVVNIAEKLGLKLVLWSVFTNDHINGSRNELLKKIKSCERNREIILLHSGVETTLESLEDIITLLKSKNYYFVTVDELYDENISN